MKYISELAKEIKEGGNTHRLLINRHSVFKKRPRNLFLNAQAAYKFDETFQDTMVLCLPNKLQNGISAEFSYNPYLYTEVISDKIPLLISEPVLPFDAFLCPLIECDGDGHFYKVINGAYECTNVNDKYSINQFLTNNYNNITFDLTSAPEYTRTTHETDKGKCRYIVTGFSDMGKTTTVSALEKHRAVKEPALRLILPFNDLMGVSRQVGWRRKNTKTFTELCNLVAMNDYHWESSAKVDNTTVGKMTSSSELMMWEKKTEIKKLLFGRSSTSVKEGYNTYHFKRNGFDLDYYEKADLKNHVDKIDLTNMKGCHFTKGSSIEFEITWEDGKKVKMKSTDPHIAKTWVKILKNIIKTDLIFNEDLLKKLHAGIDAVFVLDSVNTKDLKEKDRKHKSVVLPYILEQLYRGLGFKTYRIPVDQPYKRVEIMNNLTLKTSEKIANRTHNIKEKEGTHAPPPRKEIISVYDRSVLDSLAYAIYEQVKAKD